MFWNSNNNGNTTTYFPNSFQCTYPPSPPNNNCAQQSNAPNKPYEVKNPDGSLKGYFWYYGNSVNLIFDFSDSEYGFVTENGYGFNNDLEEPTPIAVLVEELLTTLKLEATIYNFRHEPIIKFSNDPIISKNKLDLNGVTVTLPITNSLSQELVKGRYCIELIATHPSGYNETLFSSEMNNLIFEIK